MSTQAFESVREQIAACGIWCGSCAVGNGVLADVAARYGELLRAYGLAEWGPEEIDFDVLFASLKALHEMSGCPGCLKGGGLEGCAMKTCAAAKGIEECAVCSEHGTCQHAEVLTRTRSGAIAAKMIVKSEPGDSAETLARWMSEIEGTWPNGVVFMKADGSETSA